MRNQLGKQNVTASILMKVFSAPKRVPRLSFKLDPGYFVPHPIQFTAQCLYSVILIASFFPPGATTPIGGCILQPSSGL